MVCQTRTKACPTRTKAVSTECEWFPDWEDPNDCTCPHDGYSKEDGCFTIPVNINGECFYRIAESLTDEPNKDHPLRGAEKSNPTWTVSSLCSYQNRPVAQNLNGEVIKPTNDDLPCLLGCDEVAAEEPLTIEDTEIGGKKVKFWKLLFDRGLAIVGGKLESSINTLKGLTFDSTGKIAINAGNGLTFDSAGRLQVECQELAYWVGHDNGNETVADQYTYSFDQEFPTGPITPIPGGVRVTNPGKYRITYNASAGSNGLGSGLTIINAHINGEDMSSITGVAGISWSLGDNPTGNTYDGDDYHTRGGIATLNAGDEIVLKTVETFGFAGNKKAGATMTVEQLPSHQLVACSAKTDPDGTIASEVWSIVSADNGATATIDQSGNLSVTGIADTTQDTTVNYRYCATDDAGAESCVDGTYVVPGVVGCDDADKVLSQADSYIKDSHMDDAWVPLQAGGGVFNRGVWGQAASGSADYFINGTTANGIFSTAVSSDGGNHAGFQGGISATSGQLYYEYVGQALNDQIPNNTQVKATFLVGGTGLTGTTTPAGRVLAIYALPTAVWFSSNNGTGNILPSSDGAVKVGEYITTGTASEWEEGEIIFTAPFGIDMLVFGVENTGPSHYMCLDKVYVGDVDDWVCP